MMPAVFGRCRRLQMAKGTFGAFGKARLFLIGATIAALFVLMLPFPCRAFAKENSTTKTIKDVEPGGAYTFDLKIREALALQRDFGNPQYALQTIDDLLEKIEKKIKLSTKYTKQDVIEVLRTIDAVLREEGDFIYRKNILLIEGLNKQENGKRYADCDDFTSLYMVICERLELPLQPMYAPNHMFLECRLDDHSCFYWEPTVAVETNLGFYEEWLNIPKGSGYPKIMTEREFEALQLCNLGAAWYMKGDYVQAADSFRKAIHLNPLYAEAYNNLGVIYAKQGRYNQALEFYRKALVLYPRYAAAFTNIGVAFFRMNCFQDAIDSFDEAIAANPEHTKAYHYKLAVLFRKGERKEAFELLALLNH